MLTLDRKFYVCDRCGKEPDLKEAWHSFVNMWGHQIDYCEKCWPKSAGHPDTGRHG